ncbi:MAG: N-acetylmuramoyl-L-alanine amidase [Flavobacterium sp.]|nr:N-acetylmuramoyl-L-alanine amidase [Flavobacterium sp.]MBP6586899.1 N-acetylmuramoyl-L-alanine amidase [Flavobacterium sp.]MBP7469913.1 N-acetylmuramoyl-L-alanine amidase [Flavobacterium sp.]
MKHSTYQIFFYLISAIIITSCSTNPYKKSEKSYKAQLHNYKETISNMEPAKLETSSNTVLPNEPAVVDPLALYKDTLSIKSPVLLPNGISTEWISTVNFNLRKPNFIILHHTAQDSLTQTLKTFTVSKTQVSAHYVISEDGRVVQMVNDYLRAWHGGNATWGKNSDINSASIGIELDNNGIKPFSDKQIISLLALLTKLKKDYNIPTQNIIGHADIAPTRKKDPSALFPWKLLAINGFGIWPDDVLEPAPADFNVEQGLRIIGYNTKNLPAAITAFKLHYIQSEVNAVLDEKTRNTIYNIYKKQQ